MATSVGETPEFVPWVPMLAVPRRLVLTVGRVSIRTGSFRVNVLGEVGQGGSLVENSLDQAGEVVEGETGGWRGPPGKNCLDSWNALIVSSVASWTAVWFVGRATLGMSDPADP